MTTTFDLADTSPQITLSNGNLTATKTGVITGYATAWTGADNAAKIYLEARFTVARTDSGIGVANADPMADDRWLGDGPGSIALWSTEIYHNGASIAAFSPAQGVNDWVGIAVDTAAQTIAFRNVTQGGAWSSALSIAALGTGPLYFGATLTLNDNTTANFDTAFVGAPPAGYTRWDGSPAIINYTMPAATRATVLTRNDAVLRRALKMPAVKATLALTGIAALLKRAVPLVAATRAFVLTGNAANLVAATARKMTAETGTLALTGNAASLIKTTAYQMAADAGAFVLSGVDAGLQYARRIVADQGTFALAGNAATLVVATARRLIADVGALLLAGMPASLTWQPAAIGGYTLTATCGEIGLTGRAAVLYIQRPSPPAAYEPVSFASLQNRTYIHSLLPMRRQ